MRSTMPRRIARRAPSSPRNSSTGISAATAAALRRVDDAAAALLRLEADAADFGEAGGVEQQDRAAVVGERGAGVEPGRHHRRRGGLDHQFLMIVDAVDREREQVAAGGLEHDQRALEVGHVAFQPEHVGEADFGDAAAADGGDPGAADALERDARAVGADDLLDRRAREWRNAGCRSTPSAPG